MSMTSLIQIFKLNEPRSGVSKAGKPYTMQEAEVALLDEAGEIQQVGGLLLPRDMTGDKAPPKGVYLGSFALEADYKTRQVGAVLTALTPYPVGKPTASSKPSSTSAS